MSVPKRFENVRREYKLHSKCFNTPKSRNVLLLKILFYYHFHHIELYLHKDTVRKLNNSYENGCTFLYNKASSYLRYRSIEIRQFIIIITERDQ